MYFNNKSDTSIDNELNENKAKFNFKIDFNKIKMPVIIVGAVLLVLLLIVVFVKTGKKDTYQIILNGQAEITLYQGDSYIEPGYVGMNQKRTDLTDRVVVNSTVDMEKIGEYEINYMLGNVIEKRVVKVVEKPVGATYMYLKGDVTVHQTLNEKYEEPGYVVIDTLGEDLTDSVKVDSNVDVTKEGTYRIIYSVVNADGVTSNVARIVIVSK